MKNSVKRVLIFALILNLFGMSMCSLCSAAGGKFHRKRSYSDTDLFELYKTCPFRTVQRLVFLDEESLNLFIEVYNYMILLKFPDAKLKTVKDNFYRSDLIMLNNFVQEGHYSKESTEFLLNLLSCIAQDSRLYLKI